MSTMENPLVPTLSSTTPPPRYTANPLDNPQREVVTSKSSSRLRASPAPSISSLPPNVATSVSIPATLIPFTNLPYSSSLESLGITTTAWSAFAQELRQAATPSTAQKSLAWTLAIACGLVAPGTGNLVGRAIWRKYVEKRVGRDIEGMPADEGTVEQRDVDTQEKTEELMKNVNSVGAVLEKWNTRWEGLGVRVAVEVLGDEERRIEAAEQMLRLEAEGMQKRSTPWQVVAMNGCKGVAGRCGRRDYRRRSNCCGGGVKKLWRPMFIVSVKQIGDKARRVELPLMEVADEKVEWIVEEKEV